MAITPYLCVKDAPAAIAFYEEAFGAVETMRIEAPKGTIGHAELALGDGKLMLSEEFEEMGVFSPLRIGGTAVTLSIEVDDVDQVVARAVALGAEIHKPVADQFFGRRTGQVIDPFGHRWDISALIEELSAAEIQRRASELFGG